MTLESAVLKYLAQEDMCSAFELQEFVRLNGGSAAEATTIVANWRERGWLEEHSQGGLPPLYSLSPQAYREQPWLSAAT